MLFNGQTSMKILDFDTLLRNVKPWIETDGSYDSTGTSKFCSIKELIN